MTLFAQNLFGWVADEMRSHKPAELTALAPLNLLAVNESVKLADDAAAHLEAHDPILKGVLDLAVGKLQGVEAAQLPVLEGDLVDQAVALLDHLANLPTPPAAA